MTDRSHQPHPESASDADTATIARQIGREPRALAGVACRCPFGHAAVTAQQPVGDNGKPFPTAFYLTCPHLTKQIDRLEAGGSVRRFEQDVAEDPALAANLAASNERHAQIGARQARIAASGDDGLLKCLHAHAAFELACGDHEVGRRALQQAGTTWCSDNRCGGSSSDETD